MGILCKPGCNHFPQQAEYNKLNTHDDGQYSQKEQRAIPDTLSHEPHDAQVDLNQETNHREK